MSDNMKSASHYQLVDRAVSGFAWLLSSASVQHLTRLAVMMFLARLLSPKDFGIISAATVVVYLAIIFSWIGVGPAIVQLSTLTSSHIRSGFTISTLFGLLVGGSVYLFSATIANLFHIAEVSEVLRVLSIIFPISAFAVVSESLLRRSMQFHKLAAADAASYGLSYGLVSILMGWAGFGYWSLVGAIIAQHAVRTLMLIIMQPHGWRPQIELRASKDLLCFAVGLTSARVLNFLALQGDNFVVGRWLGSAPLGFYSRAYLMMSVPNKVLGETLISVLFPTMARVQDQPVRLKNAFRRGIAGASMITLPLTVTCFILAPELVCVALGPGWDQVIRPFQILSLGIFFRTGYKLAGTVSQAVGAVYANARCQAVYALMIIVGAWIGQHWGLQGVAIGVLVAIFVMFVIMSLLGIDLTSMTLGEFLQAHFPAVRNALLMAVGLWVMVHTLRAYHLPALALLLISVGILLVNSVIMMRWCRTFFLGADGLWLYEAGLRFLRLKKSLADNSA